MSAVLDYLIDNFRPFITESEARILKEDVEAFRGFADSMRGSLVMNSNKVDECSFQIFKDLLRKSSDLNWMVS